MQIDSLAHGPTIRTEKDLRTVAQAFEASFLAEMLKTTGIGKPPEGFGGGVGEAQFSSFLVQTYADRLAENGGFGLAEHIYKSLRGRDEQQT